VSGVLGDAGRFARYGGGTSERFVSLREIEVADGVFTTDLQAALGVIQRRLGPAEASVYPRYLPFAADQVDRLAGPRLAPVVARRVCRVDHLVIFGKRASTLLERRPHVIEKFDGSEGCMGCLS
jgi:hypothetical protein